MRPRTKLAAAMAALGHEPVLFFVANQNSVLYQESVACRAVLPDRHFFFLRQFHFLTASNRLMAELERFKPDLVHFHSFLYPGLVKQLARRFDVVLQDHGGSPPENFFKRHYFEQAFRRVRGVLAANPERFDGWKKSVFGHSVFFRQIMENPGFFEPLPRPQARQITGMQGDPAFLWIGHLSPNKDPLTVLRGFARIAAYEKNATLYLIFKETELLEELKATAQNLRVADRVYFLGGKKHDGIEMYLNSAHYFVLGTRPGVKMHTWEVGGRSLAEAMSCGAIALVADNPSFRWMLGNGRFGLLFTPGDPVSMSERYQTFRRQWDQEDFRLQLLDFVREHRSGAATAKQLIEFYEKVKYRRFQLHA